MRGRRLLRRWPSKEARNVNEGMNMSRAGETACLPEPRLELAPQTNKFTTSVHLFTSHSRCTLPCTPNHFKYFTAIPIRIDQIFIDPPTIQTELQIHYIPPRQDSDIDCDILQAVKDQRPASVQASVPAHLDLCLGQDTRLKQAQPGRGVGCASVPSQERPRTRF